MSDTQPDAMSHGVSQPEGNDMKAALRRAGLTQAQFAREVDASVGCVNGWCAGRTGRTERKALAYRLAMKLLERMAEDAQAVNNAKNESLRAAVPALEKFPEYKP